MQQKVYLTRKLLAAMSVMAAAAVFGQEPSPTFFRGINLNGPAIVIDGKQWQADGDGISYYESMVFENQKVLLKPATDANRAQMIRSSRWGQKFSMEFSSIPTGTYQVFVYTWEDNASEKFSIHLNGKTVVEEYRSGTAGTWKRLGPWKSIVTDGILKIAASGGAANFSGVEIWSGEGEVPDPLVARFATKPTDEQLHFFESRIRPLLIDHCYECHSKDADELGANLLLDSRIGIIHGGDTGAVIIPEDPENSLLMKAVSHKDANLKMPPDGTLTDVQIADLAEWIRMRAPDPRQEDTAAIVKAKSEIDWDKARDFWSLKPLSTGASPDVKNEAWIANPIDRFVAAKIDEAGLTIAEDASKRILIRRATFDLIGLPPTPEDIDSFLADDTPEAFPKVVDRLLSSTQYGERWGRHWLDVVRYADTAGDNSDFPIPQAHLYRNWVIDAFNRDLPYDQFVREQLAGDLMGGSTEPERRSRVIATGYIANARRFGSRVEDYPQHLTIEDSIDNLGRTFLASTINCARCHNHKFDPITSEDYYALYGIFHSTRYPWPGIELEQKQRDFVALADPVEVRRIQQERKVVQDELDTIVKNARKELKSASEESKKELEVQLKKAEDASKAHAGRPLPYETLYAVADSTKIQDVPLQIKGDPAKPAAIVPRRFLKMLHGEPLADDDRTSGRLQLANWIVDRSNPLTARVMVNRIWQHHFGKALVVTPNDFGRHGHEPTHPELLDWLAKHFMDSGWSIKAMHRTIMLSHTYRMGSERTPEALEIDPSNSLLSSYPRHRLDAEAIRDSLLSLSGNLSTAPASAHPFPPQTEWKFTQHNPFKAVYETNQRSVYLMTQRIQRHPYLAIFDGADPSTSTPNRTTSTTPLQALYLLNDKFVHEQAASIAKRAITEDDDIDSRIKRLWLLLFGRLPEPEESALAEKFLSDGNAKFSSAGLDGEALDFESWQSLVRSLIRTNEFVYLD